MRALFSKFWVSLLYLGVVLILTWPLAARFSTDFGGGRSDLLVHQWTFWWVKEALAQGQNPFFTNHLYFPEGVPLLSHNIAWLNIAFWLPMQALTGVIVAYNLMLLAIYTLNGVTVYFLAREIELDPSPAFLAGLVVCAWPYTLSHYDHPNIILLFPMPLALIFLRRTILRLKWRDALLTGFFVALLGIGRWQLLLMGLPLLVGCGLFWLARYPSARTKAGIFRLSAAAIFSGFLMVPLAIPLIQSQLGDNAAQVAIYEPDNGRTDLLAYIVPPDLYNRVWGEQIMIENPLYEEAYEHIAASIYYVPFLGYLTLFLLILGTVAYWRQTKLWFGLSLLYIIFAAGPEFGLNKQLFLEGWTPYGVMLEGNVIGDFIRRPHRLNIILSIPVALLAGWGVASIIERKLLTQNRLAKAGIIGVLGIVMVTETRLSVPYETTALISTSWHSNLAEDPENFGLLEIPVHDRVYDKTYMFYQTQHGKPIFSGHVSRMPNEAWQALAHYPWTKNVEPDFNQVAVGRELRNLHNDNFRYLVLHKEFLDSGLQELWRDWLTIEPYFEDDQVIVYQTDLSTGSQFSTDVQLTPSIGLIRTHFAPTIVSQGGLIKVDARWATTDVPVDDYLVCLDFWHAELIRSQSFPSPWANCESIIPDYDTGEWLSHDVNRGSHRLPVPIDLPAGDYEVVLGMVKDDVGRQPVGQTIALGSAIVHPYPPEQTVEIAWQNDISLLGYELSSSTETLLFVPYWQGSRPLSASYKLFVHLVDPQSGEVVAQSDVVPRNWTYPTNIWEPREIVRDEIAIAIDSLAAGHYEIWLGWYDNVTVEQVLTKNENPRIFLTSFTK